MEKQELFEAIAENFAILEENNNGTTKKSQALARKAAGEIKKLITPYKKANMEETKKQRGRFFPKHGPRIFSSPSLTGGVIYLIKVAYWQYCSYIMSKKLKYPEYIYYQEEWNESKEGENRGGEVHDGRTSPTRETEDDTKGPRGQE